MGLLDCWELRFQHSKFDASRLAMICWEPLGRQLGLQNKSLPDPSSFETQARSCKAYMSPRAAVADKGRDWKRRPRALFLPVVQCKRAPERLKLPGSKDRYLQITTHSSKLSWNWRSDPYKTFILNIVLFLSFPVVIHLGEGSPSHDQTLLA